MKAITPLLLAGLALASASGRADDCRFANKSYPKDATMCYAGRELRCDGLRHWRVTRPHCPAAFAKQGGKHTDDSNAKNAPRHR